jgi:hypothetical protein
MKFCPLVPEICLGQVHGARKERRITRTRTRIIIIIRNGAKTISLQTLFGRLNYIEQVYWSKVTGTLFTKCPLTTASVNVFEKKIR